MDDEALIAAYYACDDAAFRTLVERHQTLLGWEFTSRGLSREEAADGIQRVWMQIVNTKAPAPGSTAQRFDPALGVPLAAWLVVIARRLAIDLLRQQGRLPAQLPADTEGEGTFEETITAKDDPVDTGLATEELRRSIRACLDELPSHERDVLNLEQTRCDMNPEPDQRDWASQHGLTPGQYTSRLHRARRKMAECLGRAGFLPGTGRDENEDGPIVEKRP
jgi:RNA polymerase sigma factor (sigma-70 family)